ncbi:MAG TPA: hypothetical protein VMB47_01220 [Candidatus Aquilonibacter sp.]|nr:hypothetical protein [Candidatus Aquilonibacter sp.]
MAAKFPLLPITAPRGRGFFVTGQTYVDQRATDSIRSAAQAFITYGVGMFIGAWLSGKKGSIAS